MRRLYPQISLVFALLSSVVLGAQDFSNKGKDFYVCFPSHVQSSNLAILSLWITSDRASSGTITMANGAFSASFNIAANGLAEIQVPYAAAHISNGESNQVINKSIRIRTDPGKPAVVAYAQQWAGARSAATLLLPVNVLGKKYYTINFKQNTTGRNQCDIIAVKNNTTVKVTPRINGNIGTPFTITLPLAGNMYQYQIQNSTDDMTGTLIESTATSSSGCVPIAVFSGSSTLSMGTSSCGSFNSSDPLFQQLYPVSSWGKNFGFIPFANYPNGVPYRVMASEDNTAVFFNGGQVATLNAGQIYPAAFTSQPVVLTSPTYISANKPICVAEYAQSSGCNGNGNIQGDPDMVVLNSIEQSIQDITIFSTRQQVINTQWVNILLKTAAVPSFLISRNGGALSAPTGAWQTFTSLPGYSYLREQLPTPAGISDSYRFVADSGFNAICYGWGDNESYAYSAGTNVKDLYQQIGVSTQYGIEPTPSVCKNSPFKFKVSLPYCVDSINWDLTNLPGPPSPSNPTFYYTTCTPGPGGPDSTTVVNGKTLYWYSLPSSFSFNVSGTFAVTIFTYAPNTDGCGTLQEISFDLNVYDPPVADFSFSPPGCASAAVQFTDITTTPRPSYIWNWDFGDPASGASNTSNLQNPTHVFSAPGSYTVKFSTITTPGCISAEITKTVVIPTNPSATITTNAVSACINSTPAPVITFTGTGGTPPYTFTYNINGGANQTISTTAPSTSVTLTVPTSATGIFRYNLVKVQNTGSPACFQDFTNTYVEVSINSNASLTLTSAASTTTQSVCESTAITNIVYTIGSGGNGASATGLPAGVTGVYNSGIFTISGTPTTAGTYNYSVTTIGPCAPSTLTGTITVTPDASITLTSAAGTNNQQLCNNSALTNITYAIGGGGTGANISGLPAGVGAIFTAGVFTISGTPTTAGTYTYTITTTGTCGQKTATGTITVSSTPTIALTSASSTTNQSICESAPITTITYSIGSGGTGATVTGLPPGVTYVYNSGTLTISGTPTTTGTFNYTATVVGPCNPPSLTGIITINPGAALQLTSGASTAAQQLCRNSTLTNITYAVSGGATSASATGLPAGVTGVYNAGVFTISGTPTVSGVYNYTVTTVGNCGTQNANGTITINNLPTANFNVSAPTCQNKTISFTDASVPNSGTINTWNWDFGDVTTSNLQNPTHSYAATGSYTVSLTVITDKGCQNPAPFTRTVQVSVNPKAGFKVPVICKDDLGVFTDTSSVSAPSSITGWEWNFGDPSTGPLNTSTAQNGSHIFSASGTFTVTQIVFSSTGCSDTIQHTILVNGANPVSDFNILNPGGLCANDSVAISNQSTVTPGNITRVEIYWDNTGTPAVFDFDNAPTPGKIYKHLYPNFQTPLTKTFTVRFRSYSGTICVTDKLKTVTVNAAPKVQFNNIPNACLDATPFQIVQASEIGGVPGTGVFTGPGVNATGLFNPASVGPGTYTIKYTYTSSAGGCVDSLSNTITVLDSASAQFSFNAPICDKTTVNFNSSSSTIPAASGTITGWTWNFGDPASGAANTSSLQNPTHLFSTWGTYNVTLFVTTSNSCKSTLRTTVVKVNPIPKASFAFPASACLPSATIAFNNSSSIADGTQSSFSYLWNFGDPASGALNTSTGSNPSHIYNSAGPFNVNLQVTSGAGCVHDTTIIVNNIHPEPAGLFTADPIDVCVGQSMNFSDNSNPADGATAQWNWNLDNGDTRNTPTFTYTYPAAGVYNVSLYITNSFGCKSTTYTKTVTVNPYPVVDAGPDLYILEGGSDTLHPVVTATVPTFLWTPNTYFLSSNTIKDAVVKGVADITYTLTVTGRGGCIASDNVKIIVLKGPEIPNIFSPNGDGIHDTWVIKYLDTYPGGTVEVFNRYGQRIFHSVGYGSPWDGTVNGKPVPMGTYYYVVDPKNGRKIMSGYVDIIR